MVVFYLNLGLLLIFYKNKRSLVKKRKNGFVNYECLFWVDVTLTRLSILTLQAAKVEIFGKGQPTLPIYFRGSICLYSAENNLFLQVPLAHLLPNITAVTLATMKLFLDDVLVVQRAIERDKLVNKCTT